MRNACPTCQTVYAVTPADVGRKIVCTRCNAALVIDEDGFRLQDGTDKGKPAPPPRLAERKKADGPRKGKPIKDDTAHGDGEGVDSTAETEEVESVRRKAKGRREEQEEDDEGGDEEEDVTPTDRMGLVRKYVDLPTGVFAVGVVLVLWFLFMPLVGAAKLKWYTARIEDEQLAHDTELKKLKEKGPAENVTKKEDEWRKRKEKLDTDVQWVQINNKQGEYWDRYGMLGGFVLTALGAIGLLMTHQPTVKKIVGAVVVCAMMILVFVNFAWKG